MSTLENSVRLFNGINTALCGLCDAGGALSLQPVATFQPVQMEQGMETVQGMPLVCNQIAVQVMNVTQPVNGFAEALGNEWGLLGGIVAGVSDILDTCSSTVSSVQTIFQAFQAVQSFVSMGFGILSGNTAAASAAMMMYNSTLLASPVTWIVIGIIALIAVIYIAVAAINHFAGTTFSATGIIMGAFYGLGAYVFNSVAFLWNIWAAFANFINNAMKHPVAAVQIMFYDLMINVIKYISNMAKAIETVINKIPGIKVNLTGSLDQFRSSLEARASSLKKKTDWVEYAPTMNYIDPAAAAAKGYGDGKKVDKKAADIFNQLGGGTKAPNGSGLPGVPGGAVAGMGMGMDVMNNTSMMDSLTTNAASTAANTGNIAGSMTASEEDLKYLRDVAERDIINRFTTSELKLDMTTYANISNDLDLDGVISGLEMKVSEMLTASAEGVHV